MNLDSDNNDVEFFESNHQQALNIATVAQGWVVTMREHKYTHALLQDIDEHCANAMMLASKFEALDNKDTTMNPEETNAWKEGLQEMLEKLATRHNELKDTVQKVLDT